MARRPKRKAAIDSLVAAILAAMILGAIVWSSGTMPHGPTGGESTKCTCGLGKTHPECGCGYATGEG